MMFRGINFGQFGMLFAALAGALLLIYILRYRRRGRVVSSTILWKRVIGTKRSIWSEIFAFLLHLLILGLVAFALTDPAPAQSSIQRRYVAVVLDGSLSMGAIVDKDMTRMDQATEKAWLLLDSLDQVDRAMVVVAGHQVRALTGFTGDSDELKKSLEEIKPQGRAPKIKEAVDYASNAFSFLKLGQDDSLHLLVFTDRPDQVYLPAMKGVDAKVVGIGKPEQNMGIVTFDVRKPFNLTGGHELMVRVVNYGNTPANARLIVFTPEATVGKEPLALAPGEERTEHYYLPFGVQGKVTALLQNVQFESGADAMITDNAAFAYISKQSKIRVLLVTKGNIFLKKALSLNPQVSLNVIAPGSYNHSNSYSTQIVIFDDFTPPKPPACNAVYIHPTAAPFTVAATVKEPSMTGWNDGHPMLRYIKLNDLTIEEANPLVIRKGDVVLAEHYKNAMMLIRNVQNKKYVGIGFSLKKSDLPLRLAFPILFHNVILWFAESEDIERRTAHQIGEDLQLPVKGDPPSIEMTTPLKKKIILYPQSGFFSFSPPNPGFYSYGEKEEEKVFAVSLTDPAESDLSNARSDPLPNLVAREGRASTEKYWPYLILLAFILVVLDFGLYNVGRLP